MFKNRKHDHIGLGTNDIEATVKWYEEVLGFKEYGRCVAPDGTPCRFLTDGYLNYEVFQPVGGVDPAVAGKVDHISFVSEDIEKDYAEAMAAGHKCTTNGIESIPTAWTNGCRYFKIATSTGEEIEFCQIL